MTEENGTLVTVWKVPKEPVETDKYHSQGVYPSGELMGVCRTEEDARRLISYLEEFSPSERFGEFEDPRKNSMEDAPYIFTTNHQEMTTF